MTDRVKQAREVAERIRERYIPANPAAYRDQIVQELATWIGQALTAEHNATVHACAKIAWDMQRKEGRSEIGNEISALVGEDSHERTEPSPEVKHG